MLIWAHRPAPCLDLESGKVSLDSDRAMARFEAAGIDLLARLRSG
ncbi:hypothetical protein [Sandarakinorhabdus cyanobacteriorum]|nr:hypothetical protein [Sandarakinorhabdus cyanobacteriorum]